MDDWKWQGPTKQRPQPKQPAPAPQKEPSSWAAKKAALFKGKPGRIPTSMVALSAAAIVSVYAIGFAGTSSADQAFGDGPANVAAVASTNTNTPTATATTSRSTTGSTTGSTIRSTSTPTPAATKTPATDSGSTSSSGLVDGTYSGTGTSKHGSISVSVTVEGGKITATAITGCGTHYPCSRIASLPGQVVAKQSASVNYVSGATDSSSAFSKAVAAALALAKA